MEVAALGLKVEGVEGIDRAAASLDGLAAAGVKAEKSTQGVGKGSAGAKPSVDALATSADKAAQAEARLAAQAEKAGISVGQMKSALRGVPAQFTDIAVSLQGGMSPLTVFLQQGGQLKDMFGGAGGAARALGGYVLGLINPFTVAAAAIAGVGVAYFQGSKEQDAFMVSMAKTGNAAGLTTSALTSYAQQISATTGTQGKAAESLNIFIDSGVKAGASLVRLTETAIAWEKATGEGVDKVAAKYVALQNDPLKAAMKLNEGMNFLTLSVYEQVKSLEEQGRTTDAAKVAMDALDSAMAERSKTIEQNLGAIQKAWNGVAGAAKWAWDKMLNVGREDSIDQQLSKARESLDKLQTEAPGLMEKGTHAARLKRAQEVVASLEAESAAQALNAAATEYSAKAVASKAAWDKIVTANASKQEKMELALANVRQRAADAGITGLELEKQLNAEREKYADKTKKSNAAVNAAKTAYESLIVSINEKIAATKSELASGEKQSEADKFRARYQQELTTRSREFTKEQKKKIEADIAAYEVLEKQLNAAKELEKAWADDAKALETYTKKQDDYLKTVTESVTKLEQEEEGHALAAKAGITHAEAMQKLAIARLEEARAQMVQGAGSADEIDRIDQEIKAREKLLGLLGTTAAREANEKAAKDALKEWEKTSELIGDTLSDYIMGGGKDAASYLKRLFATLVLQPVVKYGVQGALNSLGFGKDQEAGGSSDGMPGGGLTDWSGLGGKASELASNSGLEGLSKTITSVDKYLKDIPGMSGGIGSAVGYLGALYSLSQGKIGSAAGTAIGTAILPGIGTMIGGVFGGLLDGLDDSGTKHMGAGAIYSASGGLQTGAGIYNQATFGLGHPDEYSEAMQSGVSEITKGLAQTLDAFSVAFGKTAGYSVATAFADDSSKDGAWGSLRIADEVGKVLVDWGVDRESKFAPREFADGEAGYKEYLSAVAVDVKNAFVAMDLPGWADQILTAATDIDTLNTALQQIATVKSVFESLGKTMAIFAGVTDDAQTRLLAASGGIDALAGNAEAFYQGFYTEGERALKQRELQMAALAGMGLYIDPAEGDAAKELFRKTVQEAMGSGQVELAAQLLAMSGSFAATADYAQQVADDVAESVKDAADEAKRLADEAKRLAEDAAEIAKTWADLGSSMAIFAGISESVKATLVEVAGGLDSLSGAASSFYQGFFTEQERALNSRSQQMQQLSDLGLYIDPAEGNSAKELFRATVEEAMNSGQTELAGKLLLMAGSFAQTADYAQTLLDQVKESAKLAAQDAAQSMAKAWSSFTTVAGLAAQYTGNTSGLTAQLGVVQGSYAGATTTEGRVAALQQIISLEQNLWQIQEQERKKAVAAEQTAAQAHFDQIKAAAQADADAARARIDSAKAQLGSANDLLRASQSLGDYVKNLRFSEASGLSETQRMAALQSEYNNLLSKASRGDVNALEDLQGVSSELLNLNTLLSSSGEESAGFSARLAAQLASASAIQEASASSQISSLERQISAAEAAVVLAQETAEAASISSRYAEPQFAVSQNTQKLIDALLKESATSFYDESSKSQALVDQGLMTIEAINSLPLELAGAIGATLIPAIQNIAYVMAQAAGIDGSHAGGLASVPFNGYRAILHKDEAVLTAEENRAYRSGSTSGTTTSVSNEVLSVLLGIKNDNRIATEQGLSLQLRIARRLDDWNGNGLPATREETA